MRWRLITAAALICAASAAIALWVLHAPLFGHWLQVHTGTVNEPGPYYGFWSGFGSDLEEFGILGAIGAGIYKLVKRHTMMLGPIRCNGQSHHGISPHVFRHSSAVSLLEANRLSDAEGELRKTMVLAGSVAGGHQMRELNGIDRIT